MPIEAVMIKGTVSECAKYGISLLKKSVTHGKNNMKYIAGSLCASDEITAYAQNEGISIGISGAYTLFYISSNDLVIAGYDDTGLMYGCLDVVEHLENGKEIARSISVPNTKVRGVYTFLHNRDLDDWFYNKSYWEYLFSYLAACRFNSFNLVFSHQTYYLTPMFAYFLPKSSSYPDIYPLDITDDEIQKNHEMLLFISKLAHDRGIDFILGIWQVRTWKKSRWFEQQTEMVHGIDDETIQGYTYASLRRMISEFPYIKGFQIRVNGESGIERQDQTVFFTNTFFKAINESPRKILLDFRGWLSEPECFENALSLCPEMRLSVKYWAEFMGAPYQPAKIRPGYSYADFIKYPMPCELLWQVWSLGNPRLLIWGDPDHVRRFVSTLKLGGGTGFEICLPLAQKGYGNEPGYWRIFKNAKDEYYNWEIERYWAFLLLFGRLTYDPSACDDFFDRELEKRFTKAGHLPAKALYKYSSRIMNFLIQNRSGDFNMYIWPEIDTGGLLELYIQTPSSDRCVIKDTIEYVDEILSGNYSGRFDPYEASDHLKALASLVWENISVLKKIDTGNGKEVAASIIDFSVLANLGSYHSHKLKASVCLELYNRTQAFDRLLLCYEHLTKARPYWEQIIFLTNDHYHDNMVTGPIDSGNWKKKLLLVYEDELRVLELIKLHRKYAHAYKAFDFGKDTQIKLKDYLSFDILKDYHIEKHFTAVNERSIYSIDCGFGFLSTNDLISNAAYPVRLSDKHTDNKRRDAMYDHNTEGFLGYRNSLYTDYVSARAPFVFRCDLKNGEYEITFIMADQSDQATCHGPMSISLDDFCFSDIIIHPVEVSEKKLRYVCRNEKLEVCFDCIQGADWILSGLIIKRLEPEIRFVPCPGADSTFAVSVTSPDNISFVKLSIDKYGEHEMNWSGDSLYSFDLKALPKDAQDIRCCVMAGSETGHISSSDPFTLRLETGDPEFSVSHGPVLYAGTDMDIKISVSVKSNTPLSSIKLCYSRVNQCEEMEYADMKSDDDVYRACIPSEYISEDRDLLYYFDIVDIHGNGIIYPDFRITTPYYVIKIRKDTEQ